MVWTPPATWTPGEVVPAAKMNAQVRDNLTELRSAKAAAVGLLSGSIPNTTWTLLNFAFEAHDTAGAWTSGAPSRFTPNTAGYYLVRGRVCWAANAAGGNRAARLWFNGSTVYDADTRVGGNFTQANQVSRTVHFNGSSDFIEMQCYQSSGGSSDLSSADGGTWMELIWIGA